MGPLDKCILEFLRTFQWLPSSAEADAIRQTVQRNKNNLWLGGDLNPRPLGYEAPGSSEHGAILSNFTRSTCTMHVDAHTRAPKLRQRSDTSIWCCRFLQTP